MELCLNMLRKVGEWSDKTSFVDFFPRAEPVHALEFYSPYFVDKARLGQVFFCMFLYNIFLLCKKKYKFSIKGKKNKIPACQTRCTTLH